MVAAGLLVAANGPGQAASGPVVVSAGSDQPVLHDLRPQGVRSYWTAERMARAQAVDGVDGTVTPAPSGRAARSGAAQATTAPRSTGKLFFTDGRSDFVCSAATVNTPERNLIVTAGHCAHGDVVCGLLCLRPGYYSGFLFAPRYDRGSAPDGTWVGSGVVAAPRWVRSEDPAQDQAFVVLAPADGRNVVDVVGGNGLAWNYGVQQHAVSAIGWPAQAPYDGESAQVCVAPTGAFEGRGDAAMPCDMTGGASGGPWFHTMVSPDLGYIWAVTSRRTVTGTPLLIAHPLTSDIEPLLAAARTGGQPTARVAPRPRRDKRPRVALSTTTLVRGQTYQVTFSGRARSKAVLQTRTVPGGAWSAVVRKRLPKNGTRALTLPALEPGRRWFRVVTKVKGRRLVSRRARVDVLACPLPADRSPAALAATRCFPPG